MAGWCDGDDRDGRDWDRRGKGGGDRGRERAWDRDDSQEVTKVWIGGLPSGIIEKDVEDVCKKYGDVMQVSIKHSAADTFCFVQFEGSSNARDCIQDLDQSSKFGGNGVVKVAAAAPSKGKGKGKDKDKGPPRSYNSGHWKGEDRDRGGRSGKGGRSPERRRSRSRRRSPTPRRRSRSDRGRRSPTPRRKSPTPRRKSPTPRRKSPTPRRKSPTPRRRSPTPKRRSPPKKRSRTPEPKRERSPTPRKPVRSPSPRKRSPTPKRRSPSAKRPRRSPTPPRKRSPTPAKRASPERKDGGARRVRVYLSQLPRDMEEDELTAVTAEYGKVLHFDLHREGAYKCGWVEYASKKEAEAAVTELDDRRMDGWSMRLQAYQYPGGKD